MLSYCNIYRSKEGKSYYETCKTYNLKLVQNFKDFGKEFISKVISLLNLDNAKL